LNLFTTAAWWAMFFQPLFAFCHAFPWYRQGKFQEYSMGLEENSDSHSKRYAYDTLLHKHDSATGQHGEQVLGDALQVVAEVNRLSTVLFQHWTCYTISKQDTSGDIWVQVMKRAVTFILSFLLVECGVQMWIQAIALAIARATTGAIDYLTAASLFFSILNTLIRLAFLSKKVFQAWSIIQTTAQSEGSIPNKATLRSANRFGLLYSVLAVYVMLIYMYVGCIIYMAVDWCPQGVWTLKAGCLRIDVN
jgi:hypothetical protein